jgi:adenine-specific DNA-methyltransferase
MATSTIKANGIHYTPAELAEFLASVTAELIVQHGQTLEILDPACGDGILLSALANAVPDEVRKRLVLIGYDTNRRAIEAAGRLLEQLQVQQVILREEDFLEATAPVPKQRSFLQSIDGRAAVSCDVVISNPPYVRTQVLGSARAQRLAKQFDLRGRVDLYHAFVKCMANVLRPGGVLGLLTSNRFLTIKSGATLRRLLSKSFALQAIYDLGDTKLFSAAVLPVIVVARKSDHESASRCRFDRVYEDRTQYQPDTQAADSVLDAMRDRAIEGLVRTPAGVFSIERGHLSDGGQDELWTLATQHNQDWLTTVSQRCRHTFDDVAKVRVGIKTTADEVFIRDRWNDLPGSEQPEADLIHPLVRHFDAKRWVWSGAHQQTVLYPHVSTSGGRRAVDLKDFPRASRYLQSHRERLTSRRYVIEGGRKWYEIWVPHHPEEWAKPKVVFPDIAEEPRFFLESTGAIVNGDCYWMTLRPGFDFDHLLLMLAVANSSFITRYYDIAFHNKLYAGRRRFMTQYVKRFPLPDLNEKVVQKAVQLVAQVVKTPIIASEVESEIDDLVWESFGLVKEVAR